MTVPYHEILSRKFPLCEWRMVANDYDTLEWFSEHTKPSKEVLDGYSSEVEQLIQDEINTKIAAKESAKAKLAALGLTEAEVNAIIGGV